MSYENQNPITEEERGLGHFLHHELYDIPCEHLTFIRSYWKGQPVLVVAIVEHTDATTETLLPIAIAITNEINQQLMPYWELPPVGAGE